MAYVPKAAKDRALWITPKEAVAHVCEVERCDSKEAKQQIITALRDREIETRWADSDSSAFKDPGFIINRYVGMSRDGAQGTMVGHTMVSWNPGAAHYLNPDNNKQISWLESRAGKLPPEKVYEERPLLYLKRNVMEQWPISEPAEDARPAHHTGAPGKPTSWHYYEPEVTRLWKAGRLKDAKLADLADTLMAWQKELPAPKFPPLKRKTLMNRCRLLIRELKEQNPAE